MDGRAPDRWVRPYPYSSGPSQKKNGPKSLSCAGCRAADARWIRQKILWCWRNHPIRCGFLGSELAFFHQRDFPLFFFPSFCYSPHRLYEWWSRGIWLILLFFRADEKGRKKRGRWQPFFLFCVCEPSRENVRDVNSGDRERGEKKNTVRERRILLLHFLDREERAEKEEGVSSRCLIDSSLHSAVNNVRTLASPV